MDRGEWWAAVHGVTKSRTWLSNFPFTFHSHALEKEMATHSSVLAWRIPGTAEPGGLLSMGSQSRTRLKWLSSSNLCWVPAGRCVRHSSKHVRGVITISSATPWSWYCYSIIKVEKLGKEGFSNFLNITLLVSGSGYEDGQESDHKKGEIHCYQWKLILLLHNRPQ